MNDESRLSWVGQCRRLFQDWQTASLQGLQALQELQNCLTILGKEPDREQPPIMLKLLEQASSPRFEAYCKNRAGAKPALMTSLSTSYADLEAAQKSCETAATSISHLADVVEQECKDKFNQTESKSEGYAGEATDEAAGFALWDQALLICSLSGGVQKQTEIQPFIQSDLLELLELGQSAL